MNKRSSVMLKLTVCLACAVNTQAQITLAPPPAGPFIVAASSKNDTEVINVDPTLKALNNGFEAVDFSYTVKSVAAGPASVLFRFSEGFNLGAKANLSETVSGNTTVTLGGGNGWVLNVPGTITSDLGALILTVANDKNVAASGPVMWNKSGTVKNVAAGDYILNEFSGMTWNATAAGQTVKVSSEYIVGVSSSVPDDAGTMGLMSLSLIGMGMCFLRRRNIAGVSP